jgi:D-alanyl-D-alanine-carboxypeptidase/D-alanyl-D-alanine-endopeptidase
VSFRVKVGVGAMLVLALTASCAGAGPTPTVPLQLRPPAEAVSSACTELIPEFTKAQVRYLVDQGINPGIVVGAVAPCGREVYAYGKADLAGNQAVDENSVFEIGSIGKIFTAVLLADMVARGEVSLDDPIERYLPENVAVPTYKGESITLADLATHTSGLPLIPENLAPADEYNPYADYTVQQMYDALAQIRLTHDIGAQYEYSNFGWGVLGHILSLRSGMTYEELVATRITNELGMPDTRETLTPEMQDHLAAGYRFGEPMPLWDNPTLAGAGALRSTVSDLLTLLAANLGLKPSRLYEPMQAAQEPHFVVSPTWKIGLGWEIRTYGNLQIIEKRGATGGYWSFVGLSKDKQTGVVVLTNTFHNIDLIGLGLLTNQPADGSGASP